MRKIRGLSENQSQRGFIMPSLVEISGKHRSSIVEGVAEDVNAHTRDVGLNEKRSGTRIDLRRDQL
jgi:hypothetical protein